MAESNETKKSIKIKKPNFGQIIKNNPCGFICRQNLLEATGGIITPKYAACLDSDSDPDVDNIRGRFKVGRKVCYPALEVVAFLERRTQVV